MLNRWFHIIIIIIKVNLLTLYILNFSEFESWTAYVIVLQAYWQWLQLKKKTWRNNYKKSYHLRTFDMQQTELLSYV